MILVNCLKYCTCFRRNSLNFHIKVCFQVLTSTSAYMKSCSFVCQGPQSSDYVHCDETGQLLANIGS